MNVATASSRSSRPSSRPSSSASTTARPLALSRAGYVFLTVFFIIIFEGAIRKWITSSATLPLILLRDLLALWLVFYAWKHNHFRRQRGVAIALLAWTCAVFGWGLLQLVIGESQPIVLVIGLRFWLLYVWFAVAAACSMNEADYRASIYMAALVMVLFAPLAVLQHYSPPGARINSQVDGDEEGVFVAVIGVVRTTGTFSFTAGYATFMTMVAPVVFGLLAAKKRNIRQFLFAVIVFGAFATGALVSGSRTAVISSGLMFGAYLLGRLAFSKLKNKISAIAAVVVILFVMVGFAYFFREAIDVTTTRFQQASEVEDFGERVRAILFGEPWVYDVVTWIGKGVGFGSNLATYVRTGQADFFALAEFEGGRILLEGGLLGFLFIGIKVVVLTIGVFKSLRLSARIGSPYPALVWLSTSIAVITWQAIGQLTANALLGIMLAFGLLLFRFPTLEIFPPRTARS